MTPRSLLLSVLVLLAFFSTASCSPITCNNQCCRFVEGFPARLKKLEGKFFKNKTSLRKSCFLCVRNYFSCKKQFDIENLNSTYTQMQSKGPYKAMSELDVLFNYIETYLASKRQRNRMAAV
ncbi:interleukin-10 [Etheostoma spectabile]|uniref:interleukin-10 n=1 Tax=Etheostoma spectabile TaxID=54343 RepID=UPI0013AF0893|nr:interleukin-10-like [Etheostoma spectabile]